MIGQRSKHNELLEAATWANSAYVATGKQFDIPYDSVRVLVIAYSVQLVRRSFFCYEDLRERLLSYGYTASLKRLKVLGYVERTVDGGNIRDLYNVTEKGEYVVRAFSIRLSRLVNDTKLSKSRLTREKKEKMRAFMRPANKKGTKLY